MPLRCSVISPLLALLVWALSVPVMAAAPEPSPVVGEGELQVDPTADVPDFAAIAQAVRERRLDDAKRLLAKLRASVGDHPKIWEVDGTIMLIQNRPLEAALAFEQALALAPASPEVLTKYGVALFLQGNLGDARKRLESALALRPNDTFALRYLARVSVAEGDFSKATRLYQNVIAQMKPLYTPMHREFANFLIRTGQYVAVNQLLEPLLAGETPKDLHVTMLRAAIEARDEAKAKVALSGANDRGLDAADGQFYLALIDRFSGRVPRAAQTLEKLAQDHPENPIFLYEYAVTLERIGRAPEGLSLLSGWVAKLPAAHVLRLDIARFMLRNGDADGALAVLDSALGEGADPQAFVLAARCALQLGDETSAVRYAEHVSQAFPGYEAGYQLHAHVLQTIGRSGEARSVAAKATKTFPGSVDVWSNYIGLLSIQGDSKAALRAAEDAVAVHPEDPRLLFQMANVSERAGNAEQAESIYSRLLGNDQLRVPVLNNLALLIGKDSKRLPTALDYAQQAYRLSPNQSTIEDTLGWTLYLSGQSQQALDHLRSAHAKSPNDPEVICHLGIVSSALQQPNASALVERCLALNPPAELAQAVRSLKIK